MAPDAAEFQVDPEVLLIWAHGARALYPSGAPHVAGPVTSDRGVKNLQRPLRLCPALHGHRDAGETGQSG